MVSNYHEQLGGFKAMTSNNRKELERMMTSRNVKRQRRRRVRVIALVCCVILCGAIAAGGLNLYIVRRAAGRIVPPEQAA